MNMTNNQEDNNGGSDNEIEETLKREDKKTLILWDVFFGSWF